MKRYPLNSFVDISNYCNFDFTFNTRILSHINEHINGAKEHPNQEQWNEAWAEVAECKEPKYFKPRFLLDGKAVYRYNREYIVTDNMNLEKIFHDKMMEKVQEIYMQDVGEVIEFGCGTGHNLDKIRSRDPYINVVGSDWAESSRKILEDKSIEFFTFDMKKDPEDVIPRSFNFDRTCFLTVGSMEQLGKDYQHFLNVITRAQPKKSIHIEPLVELYDERNHIDSLAIKYHQKRGYLDGFFTDAIRYGLVKSYQRTFFGNIYNEGFMILELTYD